MVQQFAGKEPAGKKRLSAEGTPFLEVLQGNPKDTHDFSGSPPKKTHCVGNTPRLAQRSWQGRARTFWDLYIICPGALGFKQLPP